MKNRKNSSTGDLEAVSLVAGVILVLCFGMMIFDLEAAPVFMTLVIAMGVIMNGTAALERFYREKTVSAIFLQRCPWCFCCSLCCVCFGGVKDL